MWIEHINITVHFRVGSNLHTTVTVLNSFFNKRKMNIFDQSMLFWVRFIWFKCFTVNILFRDVSNCVLFSFLLYSALDIVKMKYTYIFAVPNHRFKSRRNAPFRVFVLNSVDLVIVESEPIFFCAVSKDRFRWSQMQHLASLSKQFCAAVPGRHIFLPLQTNIEPPQWWYVCPDAHLPTLTDNHITPAVMVCMCPMLKH